MLLYETQDYIDRAHYTSNGQDEIAWIIANSIVIEVKNSSPHINEK
ncbi:hypothetical protein MCHI_000791 [Candidatus Magnetoovum chiemensis]|nr:hypothetical protein MCHI_000791 [Candidatus Magnetoovum chiemensis]